jgi:hypothetical protein
MSEYMFGVRTGATPIPAADSDRIEAIADDNGCTFVEIREPTGQWKAWFAGPNRGDPFDAILSREVRGDLDAAGLGHYFP